MRTQQDNGIYSGEVKVAGTGEKAEVTLELSPGGLIKPSRGDTIWRIGIDAKVTVGPTMFFKGGTFSTSPHPLGHLGRMDARHFTAGFPDGDFPNPDAVHLTVEGYFWGSDENHIGVTLTHESTYEARWDASGNLTRK